MLKRIQTFETIESKEVEKGKEEEEGGENLMSHHPFRTRYLTSSLFTLRIKMKNVTCWSPLNEVQRLKIKRKHSAMLSIVDGVPQTSF